MRLIRCLVQPFQLDDVIDALDGFDVSSLTVMNAGERLPHGTAKQSYRGAEYKVRLTPTVIIELAAPDDLVDSIVDVVARVCTNSAHPSPQCQIFVSALEEWYSARAGGRRIA